MSKSKESPLVKITSEGMKNYIDVKIKGPIPRDWQVICDPKCIVNQLQRRRFGCRAMTNGSPAAIVDMRSPDQGGMRSIRGEIGCTDEPDGPTPLAVGTNLNITVSVEDNPRRRGVIFLERTV